MKKIITFIVFVFMVTGCGKEKPIIINNINYAQVIVGKWEAQTLGIIMEQFNYTLPSRLEFKQNKDYYYLYTRMGIREERWGKYELIQRITPIEINFSQTKPLDAKMEGVIRFIDNETMHVAFYYRGVMTRVYEFKEKEYQIYKKVQEYTPQH